MGGVVDYLGYVNLALYTVAAIVALRQWRQGRGRAGLWAALCFGSLALVVDAGRVLGSDIEGAAEGVAIRILLAILVLFPFLLYRFTTAFEPPTRRLEQLLGLMTVVVVAWTFLLPRIPEEGEPRPGFFTAYVIAFMVHWTLLTVVVARRLWRAGRGQPSIARKRMRLLAFAAVAITVGLLVSAFAAEESTTVELVTQLLSTMSALAFVIGLSPPAFLRSLWRRPEQERVQQTIGELMSASTEQDVIERVLPPMARLLGASGLTMCAADGTVLGEYTAAGEHATQTIDVRLDSGNRFVVHATPYAPYFGGDELVMLRALGSLADLALDRARLFSQEREARRVLERADELKTNFIALAAHELRNPVTVVHGLVETLDRLAPQLEEEQRAEMRAALLEQTGSLRVLVEQLLDLSRLDADAISIAPERVQVRDRVHSIVALAAPDRRADVKVDVPEGLEVDVDPHVLDRVVTNLVVNALRYGEAPVTVRAEQRDRHFRVSVEDRGPGVSPEFVPELFERFTRSRGASTTSGSGLGLAIARSFARAHRGDLLYERAQPAGARFELVIPTGGSTGK